MKCPICNGTGEIPASKGRANYQLAELRKQASIVLHKKGYGVREIQRLLGLKSPRSVTLYLKIMK